MVNFISQMNVCQEIQVSGKSLSGQAACCGVLCFPEMRGMWQGGLQLPAVGTDTLAGKQLEMCLLLHQAKGFLPVARSAVKHSGSIIVCVVRQGCQFQVSKIASQVFQHKICLENRDLIFKTLSFLFAS